MQQCKLAIKSLQTLPLVVLLSFFGMLGCSEDRAPELNLLKENTQPLDWSGVKNFRLLDHSGSSHELRDLSASSAIVLFIHGVGCPIVRQHLPLLERLRVRFQNQGVTFLAINANLQDSREDLQSEAKEYDIHIPILSDGSQMLARVLDLKRTAEVVVIDPRDWRIAYRGPINNRLDYEGAKPKADKHYLEWAIESLIKGERFSRVIEDLKGCLINFQFEKENFSYVTDVVPILEKSCLRCHSPGGIAPWAMTSIDKIRGWSPMIQEVLLAGRMPPWHADPHFGSFQNDFSLSDSESYTLFRWLERGSPHDKDKIDPLVSSKPIHARQWPLGEPDLIVSMSKAQSIPASGTLEYHRVIGDAKITAGTWLKASAYIPGDSKVVHHARLISFPDGPIGENFIDNPNHLIPIVGSSAPSKGSNRPVYKQSNFKSIAGYAPGFTSQSFFPKDAGIFLEKGSRFLFEVHYVTTGKSTVDNSKVGLYFAKSKPKKRLEFYDINRFDIDIPPNNSHVPIANLYQIEQPIQLTAMAPHMHYRGKQMQVEAIRPDGTKEILLSVPSYSFNWQKFYILEKEIELPLGTLVLVRGAFDNSSKNPLNPNPFAQVNFGFRSEDEMFSSVLIGTRDHVDTISPKALPTPLEILAKHKHLTEYFASHPELRELKERLEK